METVIPRAGKELTFALKDGLAELHKTLSYYSLLNLPECLHRNGVNLRYLGLLFDLAEERILKIFLIVEAVARVLKNDLRHRLRRKMAQLCLPLEAPYRSLVVGFLNRVFYQTIMGYPDSIRYWTAHISRQCAVRFHLTSFDIDGKEVSAKKPTISHPAAQLQSALPSARTMQNLIHGNVADDDVLNTNAPIGFLKIFESEKEQQAAPQPRGSVAAHSLLKLRISPDPASPTVLQLLMKRFITLSGLQLSEHAADACRGEESFRLLDCPSLEIKVKHMSIITNAEGHALFNRANMCTNPMQSLALFTEAAKVYDLALQHAPNDWEILLNAAECWTKIYVYTVSGGKAMTSVRLDASSPLTNHIEHYYFRAMSTDRVNSYIRYKYARFLMSCTPKRLEKAEHEFLRALQLEPSCTEYLMAYASFLREEKKEPLVADQFERRLDQAMALQRREEELINDPSRRAQPIVDPHDVVLHANQFLQQQIGSSSLVKLLRDSTGPSQQDAVMQAAASAVRLLRQLLLTLSILEDAAAQCPQEELRQARELVTLSARAVSYTHLRAHET